MPRTTNPLHKAWVSVLTGVTVTVALVVFVKYWLVPLTEFIYNFITW